MPKLWYLFVLGILLVLASECAAADSKSILDPARVDGIAQMLPATPTGVGRPITDRAAWENLGKLPGYQKLLPAADKINKQPITDQPDDLFLIFSKTGSRDEWQRVAGQRRGNFQKLVLAECVRNDGTYLPKIKEYINALCTEKTWVMPAHDSHLENFTGKAITIDLGSSTLSWQMATAYWLLGDKLDASTRTLIKDNIERRIIVPFRARYTGEAKPFGWMNGDNNWIAVCLAGTVGSALAIVDDRHTRAEFINAAEHYSKRYLGGFLPDGYCVEGLGYWNYGFGNFILLSETIRQATAGKVDPLDAPEARIPIAFGQRIEIINGVAPAIGDCHIYPTPSATIMHYLNRRFGMGIVSYDKPDVAGTSQLQEEMIYRFPNAATEASPGPAAAPELRTWFNDAGFLISRPALNTACNFGVAIKGGRNAGNHSHQDTGSYTVVVNNRCVILDPGGERYTARTFSAHRFDSKLLNSYGHDLPVVAGKLERGGASAQAVVVKKEFTDTTDTLVLDITSCYAAPDLEKLERTFVYSRAGKGSLIVTDHATFKTPQTFGTALITIGRYAQSSGDKLTITDKGESADINITASSPIKINPELIKEDTEFPPERLGIDLANKTKDAMITLTITPH